MRPLKRIAIVASGLALALGTVGCGTARPPDPVPVVADPIDLEVLQGEWWGEYSSADTGRSGRVRFVLEAGSDMAAGDVLMFGPSTLGRDGPEPANPRPPSGPVSERLTIRFVRVDSATETVSGSVEPYRDPTCDCIVTTTFHGRVSEDRIEGTYVTHGGAGHPVTMGRWRVDRRDR